MSRGKKLFLMTLMTFIVAGGRRAVQPSRRPVRHQDGDDGRLRTVADRRASRRSIVPLTQAGINQLANETGHLRISINMTWLLLTGFLVLFMQVGFAFLVTGLTRAKNAGHMMMMNLSSFVIALLAYYAVGFAFQFGGVGAIGAIGGTAPLTGIFAHGNSGFIGLHGFFLQTGNTYDVGVLAFFLFQVVFMETAGYIIIGAIAERISFAGFIVAEIAMGAIVYPIYGNWVWGGGWLAHLGRLPRPRPRGRRLRGFGSRPCDRWMGRAGTGDDPRTSHREVQGGRDTTGLSRSQPRLRRDRDAGAHVRLDGLQPGLDLRGTDFRIAVVAVNTLLAASAGAVVAMAWTNAKWGKPDISMSCNGMLAGLVAITAPCAFVAPWAAVMIGIVAGFVVCYSVSLVRRQAQDRRPLWRHLGARHVRALGRPRRGPVRRRHLRRGLERRPGDGEGAVLRRRSRPVRSPGHRRDRRLHLGLGRHVGDLHDRQALHQGPGLGRGRDRRNRRRRVRRALLPGLRPRHGDRHRSDPRARLVTR